MELQSNVISTSANNQIPGTNTWVAVINWLNDFVQQFEDENEITKISVRFADEDL